MAQQDKTDWYWNGVLAGAVNNLYYDLINVDVVHTPYSTTYRNSSFFLQTRKNYAPSDKRDHTAVTTHRDWDVTDIKYVWDKSCEKTSGWAYVMLANKSRSKIRIHVAKIEDGCVQEFDWGRKREYDNTGCGNLKLFTTGYVTGKEKTPGDIILLKDEDIDDCGDYEGDLSIPEYSGVQINKYDGGTTHGLFSDAVVESGDGRFRWPGEGEECPEKGVSIGDYILVYASLNGDDDGFAGQVRMVTGVEGKRLLVDAPRDGFKTLEGDGDEVKGKNVKYKIFSDWGEVVGFSAGKKVYILNAYDTDSGNYSVSRTEVYDQGGLTPTHIISIADVADKMYILTDNGFIHFSKTVGYDKFFIQDDAFVGADKTAIASYRDLLVAFGDDRIAVGVPDENNTHTTLYDQSTTVGLWSRYSFAEYDGDLLFVSNDKRLLALGIASNVGKYMLSFEDVGDAITGKLAVLTFGDDVFLGNDGNDLKIFIQTKSWPYFNEDGDWQAYSTGLTDGKYEQENTMTRIIKFNKQFKVWTEDWVQGILLQGVNSGLYYGENGLYQRGRGSKDVKGDSTHRSYGFKTYISAYLIENETDWVGGTNSRLANRAKLYNLSKLNRLITTLGPGVYSHESKIKITSYVGGLGRTYEFSIDGGNNNWLGLITTKYLGETPDEKEKEKMRCLIDGISDNQKAYQPKCVGRPNAAIQNSTQQKPWCDIFSGELITYDKGICIDDSLYELAPTMPLVTNLGESQDYATQIKLELEGGIGDIVTFGGWLGEMYIAPLFTTGPDGEYQLQPNTDCD